MGRMGEWLRRRFGGGSGAADRGSLLTIALGVGLASVIGAMSSISALAMAAPLDGTIGESSGAQWQSSWLSLSKAMTFRKGDRLVIHAQGDAQKVLVRLLRVGRPASLAEGLEGGARSLSGNRTIEIVLERDHPDVMQISLHAGREAWGQLLGDGNGVARLVRIEHQAR